MTNSYYNNNKVDGDLLLASTLEAIEDGFDLYAPLILHSDNNLSDVASLSQTQENLGLGTAAYLARSSASGSPNSVARAYHSHNPNDAYPLTAHRDGYGLSNRCTARNNISNHLPGWVSSCSVGDSPGLAFLIVSEDDVNWQAVTLTGGHSHYNDNSLRWDKTGYETYVGAGYEAIVDILTYISLALLDYYGGVNSYPILS